MKRLFLPLGLIAFAVVCLGIVHIDNVNKLDEASNRLRVQQKINVQADNTNLMTSSLANIPMK